MNNNFTKDEIVVFERFDKKAGKKVKKEYPVVGGRLRLFHEGITPDKESGIVCEVVKYEDDVAVIQATAILNGNKFTGIGMASKSRDSQIFPAILEMAETRAIARALRFAGFGVEYTGAEEMGGIKDFDENSEPAGKQTKHNGTAGDPGPQVDNPGEKSKKRQVWEFVKKNYTNEDKVLAENIKIFVDKTLAKYEGKDEDFVFGLILENQDMFIGAFNSQLNFDEAQEITDTVNKEIVDEHKKKLAESKDVKPKDEPKPREAKLKGQIYMQMPDGLNVAALNDTLASLVLDNQDKDVSEIYNIVLADIDGFIEIMKDHCKRENIDTGLDGEKPAEKVDDKKTKKKEYSDFRKKWINLSWKPFNLFLIQNSLQFKKDRDEYDAAVAKFDKLKVKNDCDYCFPYKFDDAIEPEIVDDNTVLDSAESKLLAKYVKSCPDMCGQVSEKTGISCRTTVPKQVSAFLDAFEKEVTEWEAMNKQPYREGDS